MHSSVDVAACGTPKGRIEKAWGDERMTPGSLVLVPGNGGGLASRFCKPRLGNSLELQDAARRRAACQFGGRTHCAADAASGGAAGETGAGSMTELSSSVIMAAAGCVDYAASNTFQVIFTSDLMCKVLSFLRQKDVFSAIQVCHKWRHLAAGLGECDETTGAVRWPAFRHLGILRQKKHSMVIKCQSRATGKLLVVKRIQTRVCPSTGEAQDQYQDQGFPVRYLREVGLLRAADHPNVMRLHSIYYHNDHLDLFSEYVGQNLEDYIVQQGPEAYTDVGSRHHAVLMAQCRGFVRQILEGVCYCHSVGIILRDMKPRNVMIDAHDPTRVKLTGLALGRFASLPAEALTREVVTQCYRAPEILLGGVHPIYSAPVDMWSVGCTLAEIASGRTLFEGDSEIGQLFQIFRVLGTPDESSWPGVSLLPDFLSEVPRWQAQDLRLKVPGLCQCCLPGDIEVGRSSDAGQGKASPRSHVNVRGGAGRRGAKGVGGHRAECGVRLLAQMLRYNPCARISAKTALRHPYFAVSSSAPAPPATATATAPTQVPLQPEAQVASSRTRVNYSAERGREARHLDVRGEGGGHTSQGGEPIVGEERREGGGAEGEGRQSGWGRKAKAAAANAAAVHAISGAIAAVEAAAAAAAVVVVSGGVHTCAHVCNPQPQDAAQQGRRGGGVTEEGEGEEHVEEDGGGWGALSLSGAYVEYGGYLVVGSTGTALSLCCRVCCRVCCTVCCSVL